MSPIGALRVVALLGGIALVAACTEAPRNAPPAPITSSQDLNAALGPPLAASALPTYHHAAATHRPGHRFAAASLERKRHAAAKRHRAHARTAKRIAHDQPAEKEAASNTGVVHHVGAKIVPLD